MRDIKFRGKDPNGEWQYGSLLCWNDGDRQICVQEDDNEPLQVNKFQVDPATVGQFTGLYDKEGKEIYEGDIIHFKTKREFGYPEDGVDLYFDVIWAAHNEHWDVLDQHIGFVARSPRGNTCSIEYQTHSHGAIVVGNIHDTPTYLRMRES